MRRILVLSVVATIVLAACSSGGSSEQAAAPTDALGVGGANPVSEQIFDDDLESVCRGAGEARATAYSSTEPGVHPVAVFEGVDPDYSRAVTPVPEAWTVSFEALDQIQLVACVNRTAATLSQDCVGYTDDAGVDTGGVVHYYGATYEVVLREATTAAEAGRTTIEAPAEACPTYVYFGEDLGVDWYETNPEAIEAFLAPFVSV